MANINQPEPIKTANNAESSNIINQLRKKHPRLLLIVVVLLACIVAGSIYLYSANKDNSDTKQATTVYAGTTTYLVPGKSASHGISFNKPNIFNSKNIQENTPTKRGFSYYKQTASKQSVLNSRLLVSSVAYPIPTAPSQGTVKAINDALSSPESENYDAVVSPMNQFVMDGYFHSPLKTTLGSPQPFISKTISANAWKFSVTVSDPDNMIPAESGSLIFAIGKNTKYYFLLTVENNEWNNNQAFFNDVLDSIKVDE